MIAKLDELKQVVTKEGADGHLLVRHWMPPVSRVPRGRGDTERSPANRPVLTTAGNTARTG